MIKKEKLTTILLIAASVIISFSNSAVAGYDIDETEATSPVEKQIFIGEASDRGNHVYQFEFLRGHFGMYVPKLANEQDVANVMRKYVPENKINKAGYKV